MPKVNKDYIDNKRMQILDAALMIFQRKPLYEITMLDIIKKAGLSKGGIYRYFSDIDEVFVALINRETSQNNYKHRIDEILRSSDTSKAVIEALFTFLGNYIEDSPVILGKIQFELTVYLTNHPEKADKIMNRLTEQENGQYLVSALFNKIMEGVNRGEFIPAFPIKDIFSYITTTIDGVVNKMVLQKCYGDANYNDIHKIDVIKLFRILSYSVLNVLVEEKKEVLKEDNV